MYGEKYGAYAPYFFSWLKPRTAKILVGRAGVPSSLRGGAAQDGAGFFCGGYLVEEVADFGEFFCRHYYARDFVGAFVMEDVVLHFDVTFVSGVVAFDLDGLGEFVHDIASGQRDIEHVGLQSSALEFDGIFAGLSGEDVRTFVTDDARAGMSKSPAVLA